MSTLALWSIAVSPVALLLLLVVRGLRTVRAAGWVVAWVIAIGVIIFEASPLVLAVAIGKGVWLGGWILAVIWPALLLYRLASSAGLETIGGTLATILPRRRESLLLIAWIFPSFVQGVAGFGTPIAVTAPLLVAMGWSPVRAVLYPLIGYHWSVTFGSMGASFYMAALTGGLIGPEQQQLALSASAILAVNCLLAGALVLLLDGGLEGLREGARTLVIAGIPMAATLIGAALLVPAVASLAAGSAGLVAAGALARATRNSKRDVETATDPGELVRASRIAVLLAPYGFLLMTALPVFLIPASRTWASTFGRIAPAFASTTTGLGWINPAVAAYTPLAPFGHPGGFIVIAIVLGALTYRFADAWEPDRGRMALKAWVLSLPQTSAPVLLLGCVATLMSDVGIISVLARGIADATGSGYFYFAPLVGGLGSFITGSTTASNALFAGLQRDVALLLGLPPHLLIAAQTAGGNVGNAMSPVVLLVGATAVGIQDRTGEILRRVLPPVALLLAAVTLSTAIIRLLA